MLNLVKAAQTARERRLESENRRLRNQVASLNERLTQLQAANEGHYRAQYDATGGPQFDTAQPFGHEPKRRLGTLWMKGGTP
ncbi:hypothetical protein [Streptomyces sp. KR55]|uniref:hypothetical protein n=1 Tax=Streptomyces sp. KR55 TaxID=3457425 RepID=UPI003FD08AE3